MGLEAVQPRRVIRFGVFEVDLDAGELRKRGARVRLQEGPFRILEMLLERSGRVVTRQELRERLWAQDTFVDFEHGLNAAMNKLRDALGDSASSPRFIETLPRRGYRFLVSPWSATGDLEVRAERPMLAVLPFRNVGEDPRHELFTDGLTQEMVIRLGRLCRSKLGIIATPSVQRYRNGDRAPERVGRELGVDYVLDGSVRRWNGRVRIGAQLVQVRDRTVLWADSVERESGDEFAVQREVATHVAGALALEFLPEDAEACVVPVKLSEWREVYLVGRHWLAKRTPEALRRALEYFRRAQTIDPECAVTLATIAETLALGVEYGVFAPSLALPEAKEGVLRSLEADPTVADAHTTLGFLKHRWEWDWVAAEEAYSRAIELNPSCATALHNYAQFLSHLGRHDEAVDVLRRAIRLDPYSLVVRCEDSCLLVNAGRHEEAQSAIGRVLEMDPDYPIAWNSKARGLLAVGRFDESIDAARRAVATAGGTPYVSATLGVALALAGQRDEARRVLAEMDPTCRSTYHSPVHLARLHAALGERESAIGLLEEGLRTHALEMVQLRADPELRPLHGTEAFERIVAAVGLR
jgi:TolB-like protein/tetratricopeptide (TPR) repeat protein